MRASYPLTWCVWGFAVIASGCYRYFSRPAGEKGLYFGLAMGGLALVAALCLRSGRRRSGHAFGIGSLALVLGWFLFEALIRDGGSYELRLLLVAALSVVQACIAARELLRSERR